MNKRLKLVLYVLIGIVVFVGLVAGCYFLMQKSSMPTVYNVQIMDEFDQTINDKTKFLLSEDQNQITIKVKVDSTSDQQAIGVYSSNTSVATVSHQTDGSYLVKYFNSGTATITAYSMLAPAVRDSFTIKVYENVASDIQIGSSDEQNHITIVADGAKSETTFSIDGLNTDQECDYTSVRILDTYNKTIFPNISIDYNSRKLTIETSLVTEDSCQVFYIQCFCMDDNGQERVVKNIPYYVDVIGYRIVDVQLLLSSDGNVDTNGDFQNDGYILLNNDPFMFTQKIEVTGALETNPYKAMGEEFVNNVVFSQDFTRVYFKVRLVYSNKTCKDISGLGGIQKYDPSGRDYVKLSGGGSSEMNYLIIDFDTSKISTTQTTDISAAFTIFYEDKTINSSISKDFKVTYKYSQSLEKFKDEDVYVKVVDQDNALLYYEYVYWDTRYKRTDEITNENGKIIDFKDSEPPQNCKVVVKETNA